jgi:isoleucyl-tRNA synthetase
VVWTTTPWTLPANEAVTLNKSLSYVAAQVGNEWFVVAADTLPALLQKLGAAAPAHIVPVPAELLLASTCVRPCVLSLLPRLHNLLADRLPTDMRICLAEICVRFSTATT